MRTPTEMDEIKANFFSKNEKMLMSQFTASRAIAIMSSSRRKRREEVGDQLASKGSRFKILYNKTRSICSTRKFDLCLLF